jgi:hypothetical protein
VKRFAGIFWQFPHNNWGFWPGLEVAPGATRITFQARGNLGTEVLNAGAGQRDSPNAHRDAFKLEETTVALTREWKNVRGAVPRRRLRRRQWGHRGVHVRPARARRRQHHGAVPGRHPVGTMIAARLIAKSIAMSMSGALAVLAMAPAAIAQEPPPRANPFACLGEGESLIRGNSTAEIEAEVEKRVNNPPPPDDGPLEAARHHCVTAELMRRVGDPRAAAYYEKAIATTPGEPGMELWYGHYLRNVRGPRAPLTEQSEQHHFQALEKMARVRARGQAQEWDDVTESWVRRGLMNLYQEDGLPLLRSKAFPYARPSDGGSLGASLTAMVRVSQDTNEVGVIDDTRRFAAEAAFAASPQRLNGPLDQAELRGIIRTPFRYSIYNRLRLRVPYLGALDASYDHFRAPDSQIGAYTEPNRFNNVAVDSFAVGWKRAFDLYPVFDLLLDLGYRRVQRTGVVEWHPTLTETINLYEARPALSRFLGPDKLTVGMNYVFMDIPTVPSGPLADRVRARAIRAFYADYAIYRQLLLPDPGTWELRRTPTRGLHLYGGYAMDDEAFGCASSIGATATAASACAAWAPST